MLQGSATHGEVGKVAMPPSRSLRASPAPSQEFEERPLGDANARRPALRAFPVRSGGTSAGSRPTL